MEVIAGISSIVQVIDSVARVAKRLNEIRESYNNVALHTNLVASQLFTIRRALEALYEWRSSDRDSTGPSKQLDKDLGMSLSCCAILISVIDGKLDDSGYMPGLKQKIKYLWLEDTLKEYLSNLEGQVRALSLLLTIFQCQTEADKRKKPGNEEIRSIIEHLRAETVSLALDNTAFPDAASVLSLDPSVNLDVDSILMKSPPYKRVYGGARLRLPPVANTSPTENSEHAARSASTPSLNESLQPAPLPSRSMPKPMPQSRGRINVWDYCPGEEEEEENIVDETIMADSNGVFELSGDTIDSSAFSQWNEKPKEGQDTTLQREETAIRKVHEDVKMSSVESSIDSVPQEKPPSTQNKKDQPMTLPAAVANIEPVSPLEGFVKQLDLAFGEKSPSRDDERGLGLLYPTAVPLEAEESPTIGVLRDGASQVVSRKIPQDLGRPSKSLPEDSGIDIRPKQSLQEQVQKPMSTHSSLYECSIMPVSNSQQGPVSVADDTLDELQSQSTKVILPLISSSTTVEQETHGKDLTSYYAAPTDDLGNAEIEGLERVETSPSVAGLSLQHVKTSETGSADSKETREPYSYVHPPERVAPTKPSASLSPPAVTSCLHAVPRDSETEHSALSSDRSLSAHDTTSTISSAESTHTPVLDPKQSLFDLRRLQNELATAKARGDSRAVQDSLQRSIEAVRGRHLAEPPAEDSSLSKQSPSLRILRFPSLPSSTRKVALGDSAASGDTISVQKILKEKVNVDSRSDSFKTPLMRAAMNGHIECMKLLKQFGADELAVDAKGRNALHIAVASSRLAAVKWLLRSYPPPKADLLRHRSSIRFRVTDVVKGVRSQRNLREASDAEGSKPLHIAAELDKGGMVETLIAAAVDVESKDNWGRTPFHRAILSKCRDAFDTLIRSGAYVAAVDAKSASSLHLAAKAGQVGMMETLLENGAKRWDFDTDGNLPIHCAVWGGNIAAIEAIVTERTDLESRTKSGQTLLHLACLMKNLEVATYLLTKLVDVNPWAAPISGVLQTLSHTKVKGSSMTPLHFACCLRDFEMAVLLLDREALINAPTPEGATALMMAVETEDTNMVNLLLLRGAKVNAKIPGSLFTALHLAARRGDLETVQQLCRKGADFNARTYSSYGNRALEHSYTCPDRKKGREVAAYIQTVITNKLVHDQNLRVNARNPQASPNESFQSYHNPSGAQILPLANPVSYAPWARSQQGYAPQQGQAQYPQYYHPDFDVPDEILPAYEPGPSAPAHLANQAPVHREYYT